MYSFHTSKVALALNLPGAALWGYPIFFTMPGRGVHWKSLKHIWCHCTPIPGKFWGFNRATQLQVQLSLRQLLRSRSAPLLVGCLELAVNTRRNTSDFYNLSWGAVITFRRKLRRQTSDNLDRWKSRAGKSQRREEKKKEDQRRERVRRQMQVREKVAKSRNTVFCQWFVAPQGRKVGSLKRRMRSLLGRWEMKKCTPLWREAHLEVKKLKTRHIRSTFGSCDVEKAHAIVVRSTFGSQKCWSWRVRSTFWKLRCWKSARCCGAKHIWKWTV